MTRNKKSKFKHVKIGSKRYYFYRIEWVDITGDAGHASAEEFDKFECSKMITHAYIYKKQKSLFGHSRHMKKKMFHFLIEIYSRLVVLLK